MNLYRGSITMRLLTPLGRALAFLYEKLCAAWKWHDAYLKRIREEEAKIRCDENHVTVRQHKRFVTALCYDVFLLYSIVYASLMSLHSGFLTNGAPLSTVVTILLPLVMMHAAPVFAYPLHRLLRAMYSKPEDKTVRLTWVSRAGRRLASWKGMIFSFLLIGVLYTIWATKLLIWDSLFRDPNWIYSKVVLGCP